MRSLLPVLLALACPIGMCIVPMLLMRRRAGHQQLPSTNEEHLKEENARLRADLDRSQEPSSR